MNVGIFTEGGSKVGFGHLSRCLAIYDGLVQHNHQVSLHIRGDESVLKVIDNREYYLKNWLNVSDISQTPENSYDYIIVDSYSPSQQDLIKIQQLCKYLVCIDDFIRIPYPPKSIILNGSLSAQNLPYDHESDKKFLLGPDYCLLRPPFWKTPLKDVSRFIQNILITMGGSDIRNLTIPISKWILEWEKEIKLQTSQQIKGKSHPHFILHLVLGAGFQDDVEIKSPNVIIHSGLSSQQMYDLMNKCDLAISSAGQTLYELAAMKLPSISIMIIENQQLNGKMFDELSLIPCVGKYDDDMFKRNLKSIFYRFLSSKIRLDYSSTMAKCHFSSGVANLIHFLETNFHIM